MNIQDKIDTIERLTKEVKEAQHNCEHEFGEIQTKKVQYQAEQFVRMLGNWHHQYPEYEMVKKTKKIRFQKCSKCCFVVQDQVFARRHLGVENVRVQDLN